MVPEEVAKVCRLFGIDPFTSISEGTLVLTCKKHRTAEILARITAKGIAAAVIGETLPEAEGITLVEGGRSRALEHPRVDPFWAAFGTAMAEGDR
jgi:hydrogenase maturation factor